jgi:TIR domain-containing protein
MAPQDASLGTHIASFTIFIGPLQISRLHFELYVTSSVEPRASSAVRKISSQSRVKRAFASYASEDREEVLARVQGITKALPDLELFLDVLALRSGEKWEERIREQISTRDVFYLFWSLAASRSRWVDWEWRTALVIRGRDYIDPVPLQPASIAPPPVELADLHFNDWTLALRSRG